MNIEIAGKQLVNLSKINVLLGKNGSGKSSLLRALDQNKKQLPNLGIARYVTPERGGELTYQGGIETNIAQDPTWGDTVRRKNRYDNFRQMSVSEYRRLETLVLRKIEKQPDLRRDMSFSFDTTLASINRLLDEIEITRGDGVGFEIKTKETGQNRTADTLSSGESELISLAIEILAFAYAAETHSDKRSYLLLDEPDVHLHPDLQDRLINLVIEAIQGRDIVVIIATHSTAILGALSSEESASIGFSIAKQNSIRFESINEALRRILPIFGAHPLSNVFNQSPIMLIEGEDDERIWQQAVRSSNGKLRLWPCAAGDVQSLNSFEDQVEAIAASVYENAKAYSLRDRDGNPYDIDDKGVIKRMRLFCRASENLILTDDVLTSLGIDWERMKSAIEDWLVKYPNHPQNRDMLSFKSGGYDRAQSDLKPLRNIFMMLAGTNKPWEVAIGQAIAQLLLTPGSKSDQSLAAFLGPKLVEILDLTSGEPAYCASHRCNPSK